MRVYLMLNRSRSTIRWSVLVVLGAILSLSRLSASSLTLHVSRESPTDLAVKGELTGVPEGEVRYVRHADLTALPSRKLELTGEFVPGEQTVTVVDLADVWSALSTNPSADTLLAICSDGYASVYTQKFVAEYRPFLVLAINGAPPESWPPPGLSYNPGPYVISVAATVVPTVAELLDAGHKRPWGVTTLEIGNYQAKFRPLFDTTSPASPQFAVGRELWINSCASCHPGPRGTFGGTKSDRPFAVLALRAKSDRDAFKRYVRDPKSIVPNAKMEPHPHYSDEQLNALIALIGAVPSS